MVNQSRQQLLISAAPSFRTQRTPNLLLQFPHIAHRGPHPLPRPGIVVRSHVAHVARTDLQDTAAVDRNHLSTLRSGSRILLPAAPDHDGLGRDLVPLDERDHDARDLLRRHPAVADAERAQLLGVLRPQRRAHDARRDGRDADPQPRLQRAEAAHEAVERVLARVVQRRRERRRLPRDRRDVDDRLGVGGARRPRRLGEEVRDCELRRADRVRQVDVEEGVAAGRGRVGRGRAARWVPEVGKGRLVDAGAGADDVDAAEVRRRGREHGFELGPVAHVGLLEDGLASAVGCAGWLVCVDERLGFGPEGEVGEDDVGALFEEEPCEFEIDAFLYRLAGVKGRDRVMVLGNPYRSRLL